MFSKKRLYIFLSKFLFCIIITLLILIGIKASPNFKTNFYKQVFETNISFSKINKIYEKYAGTSIPFKDLFIKDITPVFNEKLNYKGKETYLNGVKLTVDTNYLVPTLNDGLVVFVGEKENYGNTIIINQIDGIDVWYSNIENSAIKLYDNVKKGELVGSAKDETLYLVFKKDGTVLNYEDYL